MRLPRPAGRCLASPDRAEVRGGVDKDGCLAADGAAVLADAAADAPLVDDDRPPRHYHVAVSGLRTSASSSTMAFSGTGHISSQTMQLRASTQGMQRLRSTYAWPMIA